MLINFNFRIFLTFDKSAQGDSFTTGKLIFYFTWVKKNNEFL